MRCIPRFPVLFSAAALAVGVLASCQKEQKPAPPTKPKPITRVVGVARIEPEQGLVALFAGATGRIIHISATENQALRKGQVLLVMDHTTDDAQIGQARSKMGTHRTAVIAQEATVKTLKLTADKARADLNLNQQLIAVKGITRQTLRDSEADAAKSYQEYLKGVADLQQTRAQLAELTAGVNVYTVQARQKTLLAPYAGKLLDWTAKVGDYATGDTQVGQMAPDGNLIARTEVDELFAERIRPGQKADIRSQATGKIIGSGTVYFTGDFLKKKSLFADETTQEDRRVREVRIRLNPGNALLINGRVDCIIHLN